MFRLGPDIVNRPPVDIYAISDERCGKATNVGLGSAAGRRERHGAA
jgi:hypothetical protein